MTISNICGSSITWMITGFFFSKRIESELFLCSICGVHNAGLSSNPHHKLCYSLGRRSPPMSAVFIARGKGEKYAIKDPNSKKTHARDEKFLQAATKGAPFVCHDSMRLVLCETRQQDSARAIQRAAHHRRQVKEEAAVNLQCICLGFVVATEFVINIVE
jgi:hypothetical protein